MDKKSAKKEMPKMSLEELERRLVETDLAVFEDESDGNGEPEKELEPVQHGNGSRKLVPVAGDR